MIFFDHGHSAVEQVAQIVGQIGVNASNQRIAGEVAIAAQIDFTQQEVTNGVSAEFVDQGQRINNIALRFGHLVAIHNQPAVAVHLFRHLQAHSMQHNGPNNGVEAHDFLAN